MKDPAALIYIDKWLVSTKGMKASARGWYLNLILHQYDKGSLPNNIEDLADFADVKHSEFEEFKQVFEQVLKQKFIENKEGRLINEFALEIIRKRENFKEKRSDSGKLSYILKYIRKNHINNKEFEVFLKENIDLNFDTKDEQMLEQVFKQNYELYINEIEDKDITLKSNCNTIGKSSKIESIEPLKFLDCIEKMKTDELLIADQMFVNRIQKEDYLEYLEIFARTKNTENPALRVEYSDKRQYFMNWAGKYKETFEKNRGIKKNQNNNYFKKYKIISISDEVTREELHSAFKFYWQNEYTIEHIREKVLSGEYVPKTETVHFDRLIENGLIEVTND